MGRGPTRETPFFFGGIKQIVFLIISILLFVGVPNILAVLKGIGTLTLLVSIFSVFLGAAGVLYYTGYYHKWLRPTLTSLAYYEGYNLGLEGCVRQFIELLNSAQREVLILSGKMRSDFYELDSIVQVFEKTLKRGITIKILVGKDFDPNTTKRIPQLLRNYADKGSSLRMYYYPNPEVSPQPHFIVVDGRHIRIEEPHTDESDLRFIEARPIVWHNSEIAGRFVSAFNDYWNASSYPSDYNGIEC